jgi:hypothetical protein
LMMTMMSIARLLRNMTNNHRLGGTVSNRDSSTMMMMSATRLLRSTTNGHRPGGTISDALPSHGVRPS